MMEGMSYRVVPEKRKTGVEFINVDIMKKQLFSDSPSTSKVYKPGFNYRGLNDPSIFLDENHKRMTQNYRNSFIRLALYYLNTNNKDMTVKTLDMMDQKIPRKIVGMELGLIYEIGNLYFSAGGEKQYKEYSAEVEKQALQLLEENPADVQSYYNPYRILIDTYEKQNEYAKLADIWQRIQSIYPNDQSVQSNVEKYRNLAKQSASGEVKTDTVR
jgi:tetratricopeptide (TPR) repeat protein